MIKYYGISKDGKHSYNDFGLWITKKNIGIPSKNKIMVTVPFANGEYDFSNIYGEATYGERQLEYTFGIVENSKEELNIKKIEALQWLSSGNEKTKIYDDAIPGFYFFAECIETEFNESGLTGELKAKFTAYPFKIGSKIEGSDLWDDYCILDVFQLTKFNVEGELEVSIINQSIHSVSPEVVCDFNMEILKDNVKYTFPIGTTKESLFSFLPGTNKFKIKGTGAVQFNFRKEAI